jgi:hypothetical protein
VIVHLTVAHKGSVTHGKGLHTPVGQVIDGQTEELHVDFVIPEGLLGVWTTMRQHS